MKTMQDETYFEKPNFTQAPKIATWPSGAHVGTFRGNLLSCAAGLASINFIEKNEISPRANELGRKVLVRLKEVAEKSRHIGDVRAKGFYIGLEFVKDKEMKEPAPELLKEAQEKCF
jgi:4-aminobutyrate aminotransferase-like enzyme